MAGPTPNLKNRPHYTGDVAMPSRPVLEKIAALLDITADEVATWWSDSSDEDFLTSNQVAERLKINVQTARTLMRNGDIRSTKAGRSWRTTPRLLMAYIEGATEDD